MSRIIVREIDEDYGDNDFNEKRKNHRPHSIEKRHVEKKKSWDRETIYDPYDEEDRRR